VYGGLTGGQKVSRVDLKRTFFVEACHGGQVKGLECTASVSHVSLAPKSQIGMRFTSTLNQLATLAEVEDRFRQ
jgi:hypothetical protein